MQRAPNFRIIFENPTIAGRMLNVFYSLKKWLYPFPLPHALAIAGAAMALVMLLLIPNSPSTPDADTPVTQQIPVALPESLTTTVNDPTTAEESITATRTTREIVKAGDSLSKLFARQGLSPQLLLEVIRAETEAARISDLIVGQEVAFTYLDESLQHIQRQISPFQSVIASHEDGQWQHRVVIRDAEIYVDTAEATIDSSLFLAGARAGLPDSLIMELADIYGHMIDFVYEIRTGDQFKVTFEKRYLDGEFVEFGKILAAEFVNSGEHFLAFRYTDSDGDTGYYDERGVSLQKAFLRAPLNFRRISSNFDLKRKHPVLGTMRAHKGTDYAASTGTPIYAAGDGRISYRAKKGGYGNLVVIKHGNNVETRYAHLSKFGKFRVGDRVKQGQVIGYVGATGLASGPHLHYEFVVNGVHRNPRTILDKLPKAKSLPPGELVAFQRVATTMLAALSPAAKDVELALQTITQ